MEQQYIVACEIGSSKVKGAIGTIDDSGALNVLAVEEEAILDSVRYGVVRKIEEVSNYLGTVIRRLEKSPSVAPGKIRGVYVAVGGQSLASCVREVSLSFSQEQEITNDMIHEIKKQAGAQGVQDREVVAIISREFIVNSLLEKKPVGCLARDLKAEMNLIYCRPQLKRNLSMVIEDRLGMTVNGYIVRPLALADMVLTEDEKLLGAMLVDFGAETTTVSIYKNGVLRYLATIPMGSRNITRDITATNLIEKRAEEVKKSIGNVESQPEKTSFEGLDNAEINRYITARASEIITNIIEQLSFAGMKNSDLPKGIVIVGAGAKLKGFNSLLSQQSKMQVRQGTTSPAVRIADSSVNPTDAVDVLSILSFAARFPEKECVVFPPAEEAPVREETVPGDIEESRIGREMSPIDEKEIGEIEEDPHSKRSAERKTSRGLFEKIKTTIFDILNDGSAGDEDETEEHS